MHRTPAKASALPLVLLLATAACAGGAAPASAPVPAPAPPAEEPAPERIEEGFEIAAETPAPAEVRDNLLGTATYDLPVVANPWVQMEVDFLVGQRRSTIGRWMERGERYQGWVQEVFASYGLPRDLHHLAMVESGYTATARSHAGAVGMWQFMPSTGRGMGLRIDELVDERMDPVRSTHAAARHLRDLHRSFGGDWALAAAAYNAGSGRISRGMGRFGATTFWDLATRGDLAQETRHYVPRLYAVTIIARDPERFGYPAPRGVVEPFAFDSMRTDVPTPLDELARIANLPLTVLADLNPHLRRGIAPANYWVWTPRGMGGAMQVAYDTSAFHRDGGYEQYALRAGESVADVAAASGLSVDRIRDLNLSRRLEQLGRGDRIRLPATAARMLEARPTTRVARRESADDREETTRRSERTRAARPSRRESTRDEAEKEEEDRTARRSSESRSSEARPTESRSSEGRSARRSSEETEESRPARRSEARNARAPEERSGGRSRPSSAGSRAARSHTVESGETLWAIARRFDVTVAQLREANQLDEAEAIQPGQALRIPRGEAAEEPSSRRSERAASSERRTERSEETASRRSRGEDSGGRRRGAANDRQHTVASGETLWSLARRYDTTVAAIREANRLSASEAIQPGQRLRIPAS